MNTKTKRMTLRECVEQSAIELGIPEEVSHQASGFADQMWPRGAEISKRKVKEGCERLVIELFKCEPEGFIEMAVDLCET